MDLDKSVELLKEVLKELYNLQNNPSIALEMRDGKWRLRVTKSGTDYHSNANTNDIFDQTFDQPSDAFVALLDRVNGFLVGKVDKLARLGDRLAYHMKDPEQESLSFGRRIEVLDTDI